MKIPRPLYRLQAYLWNYTPILAHTLAALLVVAVAQTFEKIDIPLDPFIVVAALFFGNLPDIDTSYSHIGRLVPFISKRIEQRFGHRTITHSIWPLLLLALAAWVIRPWFAPWPWWIWPAMYASHLVLDMVIGLTGVPLFWPHPTRFYYLRKIKSGSHGERIIAVLLLVTVLTLFWYGAPHPGEWIVRASGSLDYAVYQYRELESDYEVLARIEATDNATHESIAGTYHVTAIDGKAFTLDIDGQFSHGRTRPPGPLHPFDPHPAGRTTPQLSRPHLHAHARDHPRAHRPRDRPGDRDPGGRRRCRRGRPAHRPAPPVHRWRRHHSDPDAHPGPHSHAHATTGS